MPRRYRLHHHHNQSHDIRDSREPSRSLAMAMVMATSSSRDGDGVGDGDGDGDGNPHLSPVVAPETRRRQLVGRLSTLSINGDGDGDGDGVSAMASNVLLTSQSAIPNAPVIKSLGRVQLHFIKESWSYNGDGDGDGLARFVHQFIAEANSMVRANVAARQGNALLCYRISNCNIFESRGTQVCGGDGDGDGDGSLCPA